MMVWSLQVTEHKFEVLEREWRWVVGQHIGLGEHGFWNEEGVTEVTEKCMKDRVNESPFGIGSEILQTNLRKVIVFIVYIPI